MGAVCVPGSVAIPCETTGWDISALALYLQPSFGGNNLGYSSFSNYGEDVFSNPVEANGASNKMSNITPAWGWGFQIEGAYHFSTGNDLDINWYHMNENTSGHLPQGTLFAGSASQLYAGYQAVAPKWDAINLELGQRFDFGELKRIRLHAGLEFARIKNTITNRPQLYPTSGVLFTTADTTSYNGFGPRLGGDFSWDGTNGLGIYAKFAGSLLVGSAKQNVSGYYDYTNIVQTYYYSTGNYSQSNHGVVVPELEAKLGAQYHYLFAHGNLGFDIGYLWINYLNSIVSQVGDGLEGSSVSTSTTANFDLNGLYFGLKWTPNV